jgi:hypothetical protein
MNQVLLFISSSTMKQKQNKDLIFYFLSEGINL